MERDAIEKHWEKKFKISTHTLTWSVTVKHACTAFVWGISTHTLTWSVTWLMMNLPQTCKFQLTRSRGA